MKNILFVAIVFIFSHEIVAKETDNPKNADSNHWQTGLSITPYGWLPDVSAEVGIDSSSFSPSTMMPSGRMDFTTEGDPSHAGFMLNTAWRTDNWIFALDAVWLKVTQDAEFRLAFLFPPSDIGLSGNINVYQLTAGYRVASWQNASVVAYGGIRHYDFSTHITIEDGLVPTPLEAKAGFNWSDVVVGVSWNYAFDQHWLMTWNADVGVGESDQSTQIIATMGYQLGIGMIRAGYRYLAVEYSERILNADITGRGPLMGITFNF